MIPMIDLKQQFLEIKDEVLEMLTEILESSQYILGPKVLEFEKKVAAYHGVPEAVAVASGTDALHLALEALGIGEGDEVITSPFTFFATAEAILYTGAVPVFADIEDDTMNIDPARIETRITEKTKAILPVHIFGHAADMPKIAEIASRHNLRIIEDCAQSFGASIGERKTGSFGDAGCFSFYPSKNLGAFGDGGMLLVRDNGLSARVRKLRNHGSGGAYRHESVGFNSRLDEIQAGILLVKLKRIETYNRRRRENAELFSQLISDRVKKPVEREGYSHVFHQYTIRSSERDELQKLLKGKGVSSVVYYPIPLHLQEALGFLGYKQGDFPVAEKVSATVLSLPMYPELDRASIEEISHIINNA